ncbi:hypothetical protein M426DRAFT_258936 [Hypoxylon sp. CI-4A]|nr:hypothetical protein M426DRAFT_258936 [Hypoxylon sp. CI-4A]
MASNHDQTSLAVGTNGGMPFFPNEIIANMVERMPPHALPYAWCNIRLVCRRWKEVTEEVFHRKFIPDMVIWYQGNASFLNVNLVFKRICKETDRVFFSLAPEWQGAAANARWLIVRSWIPLPDTTGRGFHTLYRRPGNEFHLVVMPHVAVDDPMVRLRQFIMERYSPTTLKEPSEEDVFDLPTGLTLDWQRTVKRFQLAAIHGSLDTVDKIKKVRALRLIQQYRNRGQAMPPREVFLESVLMGHQLYYRMFRFQYFESHFK